MVQEYSVLIGGQAGDGIRLAGNSVARLFNRLGYWVFAYNDYQSLIRGGHNFTVVRASGKRVQAHRNKVDIIVAFNQDTVEKHGWRLKEGSLVIFDSDSVKAEGLGLPLTGIAKKRNLPLIVRNTAALGALASTLGLEFHLVEEVVRSSVRRNVEENIAVAKEGYDMSGGYKGFLQVQAVDNPPRPILSGNEAIGLGAVKAGLKLYVAYPMTPSTPLLHYLAGNADELGIAVVQPENEIAVIGIAEGAAYAGVRTMVGTSGGGFCLMVEHLSLAGQAEIPIVIMLGERPGPAIGLPTYHAQGELFFPIFAGHGEFPRIVVSPGDAEEAFHLSAEAQNLAWRFQVPVILVADYSLLESSFSSVLDEGRVLIEKPKTWRGGGEYKRYLLTGDGVSPLAFPGTAGVTVKVNSYEHDEYGVTTEDPVLTVRNAEKRLAKSRAIEDELREKETVKTYGNMQAETVLVTWGSTKGAVVEVAEEHGFGVLQPLYLNPFPVWEMEKHLPGRKNIVCVEANSTGQLARWIMFHGFRVDRTILKYDGRALTVDELEEKIREVGA
ncbi:MAG: 2-oxoacid:acceptor oxidoreductase subunit alpha [Candidatus Brockarchaeota archaeon]|nr:2-oxoacid:acceptor oxidoreductase subunit alpha [Candidatus Brockarchaeota archaeon]